MLTLVYSVLEFRCKWMEEEADGWEAIQALQISATSSHTQLSLIPFVQILSRCTYNVMLERKGECSYVGVDTELFRVDLLLMERCDVPREGAEARRESSSHDCAMTVFWGCGCVNVSLLMMRERLSLSSMRGWRKGSVPGLPRLLYSLSDQEDKPLRGTWSSEKGKIWAWGPDFCCPFYCLLSALFTPVGYREGLLKQPHGRQHCGNTGKLLSWWIRDWAGKLL